MGRDGNDGQNHELGEMCMSEKRGFEYMRDVTIEDILQHAGQEKDEKVEMIVIEITRNK